MSTFAIIVAVAGWALPLDGAWPPEPLGSPPAWERGPSHAPDTRTDFALVIFGADTVVAEVKDTPAERSEGLQFRDHLPDGTGMLFVFGTEAPRSFWMKDTYLDLDIAFLDVNFRIVDIQQMDAHTEELHTSAAPAMFALEVRQGWLAENDIQVGHQAAVVFDPPGVRRRIY